MDDDDADDDADENDLPVHRLRLCLRRRMDVFGMVVVVVVVETIQQQQLPQ